MESNHARPLSGSRALRQWVEIHRYGFSRGLAQCVDTLQEGADFDTFPPPALLNGSSSTQRRSTSIRSVSYRKKLPIVVLPSWFISGPDIGVLQVRLVCVVLFQALLQCPRVVKTIDREMHTFLRSATGLKCR